MKTGNIYRLLRGAAVGAVGAVVLFAASCVREPLTDGDPLPPVPEGKVRLELFTDSGDFQQPVSRAGANEDDIATAANLPWVLVFRGASGDDNATFVEAVQAVQAGSKIMVTLTANANPCRLLIIANAPAQFYDGSANNNFNQATIGSKLASTTLTQVATILNTIQLSDGDGRPYVGGYLPMSCLHDVARIDEATQIGASGSQLALTRAVAKVTVASTAPGFSLTNATVAGAKRYGRLYRASATAIPADSPINYMDGTATASGNNTFANPIYIYESAAGTTSVVVKGTYNGTPGYYRLAFKNGSSAVMPVERNKWYKFTIASVTGAGYGTLTEAIAAPPSNIIAATIDVIDLSSHDIVDNGQYYLGVSNSELIVYNDQAVQSGITAVTVTTDAPTSVTMRDITVSTGISLTTANQKITVTGSAVSTDIKIDLTAAFTAGTITVKVGNLTKTIKVTRRAALGYGASATEFAGSYAAGRIEDQGTGGDGWLSLSLDGITPASDSEIARPDQAGKLYLMAAKNVAASGTTARTGGEVYLSRQSNEGRVKLYVAQGNLNVNTLTYTMITNVNAYVGTFHKCDQTGERIIRMGKGSPYIAVNGGAWTATVIEGDDWIKLSTAPSKDTGINFDDANATPADMNDPVNDALYQVEGNATSVSGNHTTSAPIYFRVGMKSTYDPTKDKPVRYGVILLEYGSPVKYHKIYVRQGEGADYLMRPGDPGTDVGGRDLAVKFSPYNLTAPAFNGGGTSATQRVDVGKRGGVPTDYPSQAGAFFLWAHTDGVIAYNAAIPNTTTPTMWGPSNTVSDYWDNNNIGTTYESCPTGYRRPTDGITNGDQNLPIAANSSEMFQSLFLNPPTDFTGKTDNVVWGYYADGFFDRRMIGSQTASMANQPNTAVATDNSTVAYVGRLFYNQYNDASLFLPASGSRSAVTGHLNNTGHYGYYWSASSSGNSSGASTAFYLSFSNVHPFRDATSRHYGFSIRCVAENPLSGN